MEWSQFAIFLVTMSGILIWQRSDIKEIKAEAAADRRDILQIIRGIQEEIKDFHGRLERHDAEFKAHLMYSNSEKKSKIIKEK